jgi:predicted lipoprotein with Yx(FWY)xxD motif
VRPVRLAAAAPALAALLALMLTGCGTHAATRPSAERDITLSVGSAPGLGRFVVTDGWTLYMYPPDRQRRVTCTQGDECQEAWPPLFVGAGHRVLAGPGVQASLIGTMPGDGGRVVTYNHWPLYFYVGDSKPGQVNGQDQGFNWFVIAPDGVPNKTDMASPTG